MIRAALAFLVAAGTAALFCILRMQGIALPAWEWLAVMSTVGVLAFWLAPPKAATGSAARSAWPALIALGTAIVLGMARSGGPLAEVPEIFNRDGEGAVLIYVAAVMVFFFACGNARTAHRDGQPVAAAHFLATFLAASTALVVSAAILYLE